MPRPISIQQQPPLPALRKMQRCPAAKHSPPHHRRIANFRSAHRAVSYRAFASTANPGWPQCNPQHATTAQPCSFHFVCLSSLTFFSAHPLRTLRLSVIFIFFLFFPTEGSFFFRNDIRSISSPPPPASPPNAPNSSTTPCPSDPDAAASRSHPPQTPPHNPCPVRCPCRFSARKSNNNC